MSAGSVLILLGCVLCQRRGGKRKECDEDEPSQMTLDETKENSVRGLELTAEKINSYSAAEGAKALAEQGADYRTILAHYYPGTELRGE